MSSPNPIIVPGFGEISSRLLNFNDALEGLSIQTSLYRQQRRSVAAMLQRELDNRDVTDPLFIPLTAVDQKKYYLQPVSMEVRRERPITAPCRGGILCEERGEN